jgi:hypothetical protein
MDIFESLENLKVSEECFEDIMELTEAYINELKDETKVAVIKKRIDNLVDATNAAKKSNSKFPREGSIDDQAVNLLDTAELVKKQKEMANKLNRSSRLAGRSIKDPAQRLEVKNYANKRLTEDLMTPVKKVLQPISNQFDETKRLADNAHKQEIGMIKREKNYENEFNKGKSSIRPVVVPQGGSDAQKKAALSMNHPSMP